jgi:23S rRNA (pseudouridine1915-N3)-methyltransferase
MLDVTLICVGKMKEKFYIDAAAEYIKRLGASCRITVTELAEIKKSQTPSEKEIDAALLRESEAIKAAIPKGSAVIAMCIEGKQLSSEELSDSIAGFAGAGVSKLCFIIGSSDGLHDSIKSMASLKLSMSRMTFPHHLARVMLLEQLYRAFSIQNGGKYHK